jgi:hypothetical protein
MKIETPHNEFEQNKNYQNDSHHYKGQIEGSNVNDLEPLLLL